MEQTWPLLAHPLWLVDVSLVVLFLPKWSLQRLLSSGPTCETSLQLWPAAALGAQDCVPSWMLMLMASWDRDTVMPGLSPPPGAPDVSHAPWASESPHRHPSSSDTCTLSGEHGWAGIACPQLLLAPSQRWHMAASQHGAKGQTLQGSDPCYSHCCAPTVWAPGWQSHRGGDTTQARASAAGTFCTMGLPGRRVQPLPQPTLLRELPGSPGEEESSATAWLETQIYCDIGLQPVLNQPSGDSRSAQTT